jgi:hypothetical protein
MPYLPGAAVAGSGAVLLAAGYRSVRFNALTLGIELFAALGCGVGAWFGQAPLAAFLTAIGALIGFALGRLLFHAFVVLAAALGGSLIGGGAGLLMGSSHPLLLAGAMALGFAVLAILDARAMTVFWTSAVGAALVTIGTLSSPTRPSLWFSSLPRTLTLAASSIFLILAIAGIVFQVVTTRDIQPKEPASKPRSKPRPLAEQAERDEILARAR